MKKAIFLKKVTVAVLFLISSISLAFTEKEEAVLSKLKAALVQEPFPHEMFPPILNNAAFLGDLFSSKSDQFLEHVLTVLKEHGKIDLINSKNNIGETPLFYAVAFSRQAAVRKLLTFGADRFVLDGRGFNLLHHAVSHSSPKILRILLEESFPAGKDKERYVNSAEGEMLLTPLHFAASVGDKESVEILIQNGADLNLKNRNGSSAGVIAIEFNNQDLAIDLVMRNPTINRMAQLKYMIEGGWSKKDDDGDYAFAALVARNSRWRREMTIGDLSLLMGTAIKYDKFNKFKILLDAGVPVTSQEVGPRAFFSPLNAAVRYDRPLHFQALVERSSAALSRDETLRDSFIAALEGKRFEFVTKIFDLMNDSILKTKQNAETFVVEAVGFENSEAVGLLLEKLGERSLLNLNFKAEKGPHRGMTALALACKKGNLNLATQLLDAGANPNLGLDFPQSPTALYFAALSQNVDLVKLLLDRGARSDVKNSSGKTVHEFAKEKRLTKSLDYLVERFLSLNQIIVVNPSLSLRDTLLEIITDMDETRRLAVTQYEPNLTHEFFPLWNELVEKVNQSESAWLELMSLKVRFKQVQSKIGIAESLFEKILPSHPQFKESQERIQIWKDQFAKLTGGQFLSSDGVATDPVVIDNAVGPLVSSGAGANAGSGSSSGSSSSSESPLEVTSVSLSLLKTVFETSSQSNRSKIGQIELLMGFEKKEELEQNKALSAKLLSFADKYIDPTLGQLPTQATLRKILKSRGNSFTLALLKLLASNPSEGKLKKLLMSKEFELHRF